MKTATLSSNNRLLESLNADRKALEDMIDNPTNMADPKIQQRMREVVEKATDRFSQLNDFDLGGSVRMLMRDSFMHEPLVCAARDRIYKLSMELAEAKAKIAELEKK